jgi:hypothetical protein
MNWGDRPLPPGRPGDRLAVPPGGWTATGTAFPGAAPGTLAPVNLAAFGAAMTGTSHVARSMATTTGVGPGSASGMPIRRLFEDLPSASSLFERAKSWFTGTTEADNAGQPSASGPAQPDPQPTTNHAEIVENPRSLSDLLRPRSAMTEPSNSNREQPVANALSPREWDQLVDLVVDRLEDRVRDELARRGRRFSPGVF